MTSTDYTIFMPIKPTAIYSNQVKSSKSSYINHCCLSFNSFSKTLLCSFTDISILIPSWFRGEDKHFSGPTFLSLAPSYAGKEQHKKQETLQAFHSQFVTVEIVFVLPDTVLCVSENFFPLFFPHLFLLSFT